MNTKLMITMAAGAMTLASLAMPFPTKEELAAKSSLSNSLMADTVAAKKRGEKTNLEVAEKALALADSLGEEDSAVKFNLMSGAFDYLVKAEEYEKAAELIDRMLENYEDFPRYRLSRMLSAAMKKIQGKKGGELRIRTMYERVRDLEGWKQKLAEAKKNAAAYPIKYAQYAALCGDWKTALPYFRKAGFVQLAKIVDLELAETKKPDEIWQIADYWWKYSVSGEESSEIEFRKHAVDWYRKGLSSGAFSDSQKLLAEQNVEKLEAELWPPEAGFRKGAAAAAGEKEIILPLDKDHQMKFIRIEPREFEIVMGKDLPKKKVKITRPYYISETPVTMEQWKAIMGYYKDDDWSDRLKRANGKDCIQRNIGNPCDGGKADKFVDRANSLLAKSKLKLPKNYVLRLPSRAEMTLTMLGDGSDPDYVALAEGEYCGRNCRLRDFRIEAGKRAMAFWREKDPEHFKEGDRLDPIWYDIDNDLDKSPSGVRGMNIPGTQLLLDRVDYWGKAKTEDWLGKKIFPEYDSDIDPVYVDTAVKTSPMQACGDGYFFQRWLGNADPHFAYLCIGPDLLAEKAKAK